MHKDPQQYIHQGVNAMKDCISLSNSELMNGIFEQMKGKGASPPAARFMVMHIEEQQKMMLEDMGDTDTAEESTLPELLGNNLDVYLTSLDAYIYEADPMARGRGIAESVENTAKRINSLCINYLNTAINLIEKECASNHLMDEKELAYLKTWSAERAKDQFDFQAARTLYKGSLDEMEYPSKSVEVWELRLANLGLTVTYALGRCITYCTLCLSICAYADAGMYETAIEGLNNLVKPYDADQHELMLRQAEAEQDNPDDRIIEAM
jgi:hypothetical protein